MSGPQATETPLGNSRSFVQQPLNSLNAATLKIQVINELRRKKAHLDATRPTVRDRIIALEEEQRVAEEENGPHLTQEELNELEKLVIRNDAAQQTYWAT